MLTEMKQADREIMAKMVEDLCRSRGAGVSRRDPDLCDPREIGLEISFGDARVCIDFDGSKGVGEDRDVYCMPWVTHVQSGARMTDDFGVAVGAGVNPHHRSKCTGFAAGIDKLLISLSRALDCIAAGYAFERPMAVAA
ncbi:hypothetical protein [Sphingomonas sp. 3-13AW]|uniref:hypothetical protein n=1 Tax=Sphingomonas sp. 3-13AW TaxID=3050450 RepID=UPI003BB71CD0